jgi:hypothetical protein
MSVKFSKHSIFTDFYTTADSGNSSKFSIGFFKIEYTTEGKKSKVLLSQEKEYSYISYNGIAVSEKNKIQFEEDRSDRECADISTNYHIFENDTSAWLGFTHYHVDGKTEVLSVTKFEFEKETEGTIELDFKIEEDLGCEHFIRTLEENPKIFNSENQTDRTQIDIENEIFTLLFSRETDNQIDAGFAKWLTFANSENKTGTHTIPLNFSIDSDGDKLNVYVSCELPEKTKNITFVYSFGLLENALPINKPPIVKYMPVLEIYRGDKKEINLSDIFYDPEGGELSFCATSEHADITISNSILSIDTENCFFLENITITASDQAFESNTFILQIRVLDPSPKATKQTEDIVFRDKNLKILNLTDYFTGKELRYTAETSNKISIEFINDSAYILPIANWNGAEKVVITARNSLGLAKIELKIFAEFPNHAPISKDIPDMHTDKEVVTINLTNYFHDEDGDILTYSVYSNEVTKIKIEKDILKIRLETSFLYNSKGVSVKVSASDGKYETYESFLITYENRQFYYGFIGMISIFAIIFSWVVVEYTRYKKENRSPVRLEDYKRYKKKG